MGYCSLKRLHGGGLGEGSRTGASFLVGAPLGGLPSGDPEGRREAGSEDGNVHSPGTLRDS
jgi:hypothetical protein